MNTPVTEAAPISAVPDFIPGDAFADNESIGNQLRCEQCSTVFEHTGRGRKPKRCPDCRRQRASGTRQTRSQRPSIALLGQSVTLNLQTFGTMVSMVNQYDGQVIIAGAPIFGNACANVAEHDPRFRRMLERSSTMIVYGELLAAALVIVIPILANHGRLPASMADNMASVYQQMGSTYQQHMSSDGTVPGS